MNRIQKLFEEKKKLMIGISAAILLCCIALCAVVVHAHQVKSTKMAAVLTEASRLSEGYWYEEAIALLNESGYASEDKVAKARQEIAAKQGELTEYTGQFYHVFFHSLIVYPELAFDGDYKHEGYDMWMTTVSEFKAMLPQLYERGFILYSLKDIKKGEKILLPPGKKPLIISVDDVNYYGYMKGDGFADRLVIGENGDVMTEVITPTGNTELTYDGDVMPILDQFVKAHPDFSFRGAKGIVAVTGYEGVFGYNFIKAEDDQKDALKAEATKIASALKESGWLIACHSYTHNDYFKDGKVSDDDLHYDTNRFKERIYDIVLQPDIYISPFGYHLGAEDERMKYLQSMGYQYFCPVSIAMRTIMTEQGVVIQERFNLDRYNMRTKKEFINQTFFDVDSVYYQ